MIGEARTDPPSETRSQAEPYLARSLSDAKLVAAIFREGTTHEAGRTEIEGYALSHDGGLTWSPSPLLSTEVFDDGIWQWATAPTAAFGAQDELLFFPTVWNPSLNPLSASYLFSSQDGGGSFLNTKMPHPSGEGSGKQSPAVNTFTKTVNYGRIAVSWVGEATGTIYGLRTTHSDDGGKSWTAPRKLTTEINRDVDAQSLFLPDGSLVILYVHLPNGNPGPGGEIRTFLSTDGGETFGQSRKAVQVDFQDNWDPNMLDAWYHSVSVATDRLAGVLYLTWEATVGLQPNARKAIMFSRSIDKGLTWSTPVAVNDTPNKRQVFSSQIAVSPDGQHVLITFYDRRNDPGDNNLVDLYLAESFDGGGTWEPNLRVSDVSSDTRNAFDVPDGGSTFKYLGLYFGLVPSLDLATPGVACWIDTRSAYPRAYTAQIQRTRGATFETWRKLRWKASDLANPAISGPAADPDGDGIPNFSEYAMGLEPRHPDMSIVQTGLGNEGGCCPFMLTFTQPSVLTDVEIIAEESSDLTHWQPAPHARLLQPEPGPPFWVARTWFFPVAPPENKFVRLVAKP